VTADGLLVVDKPSGMTSHDVVAQVRRVLQTRKVGHAGTLDPMATGVLVLGIGRATRLLGYVSGADKTYLATIRLGQATFTDDAEGEVIATHSAAAVTAEDVAAGVSALTGDLQQVPSTVSAVKVAGERAYRKARAGQPLDLPSRPVRVSQFDVDELTRPAPDVLDVSVTVTCSSGTYVRALARDLGASLGVGGHLRALRRTRVGGFDASQALALADLTGAADVIDLDDALSASFPRLDVDAADAVAVSHGRPLPLPPTAAWGTGSDGGPLAVFGPDGHAVALVAPRDGSLRVVLGLVG
jgi:tRNA pseudouridine55 synthase